MDTIKKINERKTVSSIEAVIDLDDFKKQAYYDYHKTEYLLSDLLDDCLSGTGWVHKDSTLISRKHTVELKNCNTLDIINEASKLWGCQFSFDNKNKVITAIDTEIKQPTGVFFTDELNLLSVGFKGDSSTFITRLKCRGKKDENDNYLTFADINDGKDYVENYDYSDKVITGIWVDERYTNKQSLKDDAIEKLKTLAIPVRSYECTIADLAKIDPKYNNFAVALYDIVTLIDRERKTRVNHRIVKLREYDKTPLKNVITLNSVTHTITGNIKQLDTLISNAGDIKVDGITLNEFKRDINNNSLEIQKRYTKGETDTILDTKILQSESEIMTKVSEKYSTKEDTTNEISSAVTQTKSDITFDFKNGGLSSNIVFNSEGQIIYNGGLTIFNRSNNKQFYADENGNLVLSGTIFANSGKIGGWTITSSRLQNEQNDFAVSIACPTAYGSMGSYGAHDVIVVHDKKNDTYPFVLTSNGELVATKANITGTISASSGKIGGYTIEQNRLYCSGAGINNNGYGTAFWAGEDTGDHTGNSAAFHVYHDGSLYATKANITGAVTATSGSVGGWNIEGGRIYNTNPTTGYTFNLWNPAVAGGNIISCDNGSDYPFYVTRDGFLKANNANITGTINATSGNIGKWQIGYDKKSGEDALVQDNGSYYVSLRAGGVVAISQVEDLVRSWTAILAAANGSDKRIKNNIADIDKNTELFFDNLKPQQFNYKENSGYGNSKALHFGYVAQDIIENLTKNNIHNSAIIWQENKADYYSLRYQEFIALNTWQIQRLKKKVIDLTEKLENQQKEIDDLKALIQ